MLLTLKVTPPLPPPPPPPPPPAEPIQTPTQHLRAFLCLCLCSASWTTTPSPRTSWAPRPWTSAGAWAWPPPRCRRSSPIRSRPSTTPSRRGWSASTPEPRPTRRRCRSLWSWSETSPSPEENWVSRCRRHSKEEQKSSADARRERMFRACGYRIFFFLNQTRPAMAYVKTFQPSLLSRDWISFLLTPSEPQHSNRMTFSLVVCSFVPAGPTMKLRRPIVVKMYQDKIEEMYAGAKL